MGAVELIWGTFPSLSGAGRMLHPLGGALELLFKKFCFSEMSDRNVKSFVFHLAPSSAHLVPSLDVCSLPGVLMSAEFREMSDAAIVVELTAPRRRNITLFSSWEIY